MRVSDVPSKGGLARGHKKRALAAMLLATLPAAAQDAASGDPVRCGLILSASAVGPGEVVRCGVRLAIAPEWHVYWSNPGETGLPVTVTARLPDGFSAGPLRWPAPTIFPVPSIGNSYGYEEEVVLLLDVSIPKDAPRGDHELSFDVDWMACGDTCALGEARVARRVTVGKSGPPDAAARETLDAWERRVPRPVDRTAPPLTTVRQDDGTWHLTVDAREGIHLTSATFIPGTATGGLLDATASSPEGCPRVDLTIRASRPADLDGVLVLEGRRAHGSHPPLPVRESWLLHAVEPHLSKHPVGNGADEPDRRQR